MNDKVLHTVEFNKIIDQLTENANSAPAKALCRELRPMDNLPDIHLSQLETDAALQLLICQMEEPSLDYRVVHTQTDLIERESTAR